MPALAESSVGVGFAMPVISQIAKNNASPFLSSLPNAPDFALAHIANMETDKNGGPNFLRAWRLHRKMTLQELADAVVPPTTAGVISHIEQGERALSAKWLRRLAPALGTTPGHLLDHDPSDLDAEVIDIFGAMNDAQKKQAARILRAVVEDMTGTGDE